VGLVCWVIDKKGKSILDLGCGQGNPMKLIKKRMKVEYAVGVDLFEPYLSQCRKEKIFNKVIKQDVRKVRFDDKSFDIVLLDEIIEHLSKKEAWILIKKAEDIAKRQVIVATPIGPCYHPAIDNNKLQLHRSYFLPEEFEKKGYRVIKYGWRILLDSHSYGLIYKTRQYPFLRRFLYGINFLATPLYYIFQDSCDYIFVAYKNF